LPHFQFKSHKERAKRAKRELKSESWRKTEHKHEQRWGATDQEDLGNPRGNTHRLWSGDTDAVLQPLSVQPGEVPLPRCSTGGAKCEWIVMEVKISLEIYFWIIFLLGKRSLPSACRQDHPSLWRVHPGSGAGWRSGEAGRDLDQGGR